MSVESLHCGGNPSWTAIKDDEDCGNIRLRIIFMEFPESPELFGNYGNPFDKISDSGQFGFRQPGDPVIIQD